MPAQQAYWEDEIQQFMESVLEQIALKEFLVIIPLIDNKPEHWKKNYHRVENLNCSSKMLIFVN